jgi:hypothetical protein
LVSDHADHVQVDADGAACSEDVKIPLGRIARAAEAGFPVADVARVPLIDRNLIIG